MKQALNCPIEISGCQLIPDSIGHIHASVRCTNLFDSIITGLEGYALWLDKDTNNTQKTEFSYRNMRLESHDHFDLKLSCGNTGILTELQVCFTLVTDQNGSIWKGSEADLVVVPEPPKITGSYANKLMHYAGTDAVCCAEVFEDRSWMCVCGRYNLPDAETCFRCGRVRDIILEEFSPEKIDSLPDIQRSELPEMPFHDKTTAKAKKNHKKKNVDRRLSNTIILLIIAILFAVAALGIRIIRYKYTDSAGMMPTSYVEIFDNV